MQLHITTPYRLHAINTRWWYRDDSRRMTHSCRRDVMCKTISFYANYCGCLAAQQGYCDKKYLDFLSRPGGSRKTCLDLQLCASNNAACYRTLRFLAVMFCAHSSLPMDCACRAALCTQPYYNSTVVVIRSWSGLLLSNQMAPSSIGSYWRSILI